VRGLAGQGNGNILRCNLDQIKDAVPRTGTPQHELERSQQFKKANHNPRPSLNGNRSTDVIMISAKSGSTVKLSAEGTDAGDDGQNVHLTWWIYREAATLRGANLTQPNGLSTKVVLPSGGSPGTVHVILQAEDDDTPHLVAYRRMVSR